MPAAPRAVRRGARAAPPRPRPGRPRPPSRSPPSGASATQVQPHVPLRPKTTPAAQQPAKAQQKGWAARRRRQPGRRRRRPEQRPEQQEKPGATRIIEILPEGTPVKAGDVVCKLDSAAFEDELQAQEIRYAQAKAWVEQAQSILEVSEIALREYRDGIYPQDVQLVRQYISTCRTEFERASKNLAWSRDVAAKGFRASAQVKADEAAFQQATIALREAEGMAFRLEKYTGPKLITGLSAKVEAVRADLLNQEAAFQLEEARLNKLKAMIANCTMRTPATASSSTTTRPIAGGGSRPSSRRG